MPTVHLTLGLLVLALFAAVSALGAWRWYRVESSSAFWLLLRTGQVALVAQAALGGVLLATGHRGYDDLHLVYGLLPLAVSFVAEQLRVAAADTVLDARGLDSAKAVGKLPGAEQRSVVVAIVRRELGVMTLAALTITGLVVRAAFVSSAV